MYPIDLNETFGTISDANGGSGYYHPPGSSNPYWVGGTNSGNSDWQTQYTFIDEIGQTGTGQNPAVTYTSSSSPYTYNTVYLQGGHYFFAGSLTSGTGFQVYTGTIEFYRDHGDNTP